jgi:5'(3')-deoxyribonucleotidase
VSDDRPTVGVDIDGVTGSFLAIVREGIEAVEGPEAKPDWEDLRYGRIDNDATEMDAMEAVERTHENEWPASVPRFPEDVEPVDGAREALERLAEEYEVVMVTARPDRFFAGTKRWLRDNDLPHDELRTTGDKDEETDLDVLVDDHLAHVRDFAATDRPAVLFDRPWSGRDEDVSALGPGTAVRVSGEDTREQWPRVVEAVHGLVRGETEGLVDDLADRGATDDPADRDGPERDGHVF